MLFSAGSKIIEGSQGAVDQQVMHSTRCSEHSRYTCFVVEVQEVLWF